MTNTNSPVVAPDFLSHPVFEKSAGVTKERNSCLLRGLWERLHVTGRNSKGKVWKWRCAKSTLPTAQSTGVGRLPNKTVCSVSLVEDPTTCAARNGRKRRSRTVASGDGVSPREALEGEARRRRLEGRSLPAAPPPSKSGQTTRTRRSSRKSGGKKWR